MLLPVNNAMFLSSSTSLLLSTSPSLKLSLYSRKRCGVVAFWTFGPSWLHSILDSKYAAIMHFSHLLVSLFSSIVLWQPYAQPSTNPTDDGDITQPGTCPWNLVPTEFEFPHQAIPISINNPDEAYPNTLTPYVTAGDIEMIFNFDIPPSRKGQMCLIVFLLPNQSQLSTSFFQLNGSYGEYLFSLSVLGGGAVAGITTYSNRPLQANPFGFPSTIHIQPGHAWALGSTRCMPGQIAVTMSSSNSSLTWFQDSEPCPIGLYIVYKP